MKRILFIIITGLCLNAVSQNNHPEKKILIGVQLAPNYACRHLKSNTDSINIDIKYRDGEEIPTMAFSFGINSSYFFNKKMGLTASVLYSEKGYRTPHKFYGSASTANNPTAPSNNPNEIWYIYKYNYLDVPIRFNYVFIDKKISFYGFAGVINNFLLNNNRIEYLHNMQTGSKTERKKTELIVKTYPYAISALFGLGLDINLNKIKIRVEPSYDRFLTSSTNDPVKIYFYNFSLNLGICYTLSK